MTYDVIARARQATARRVAALIAGLCVVAALLLVARAHLAGSPPQTPPASSTGPSGAGPSAGLAGCLGDGHDRPRDLGQADVSGVSVPVSGRCGPRDSSGGLARGFSRDADGAVLAAVHLLVRVAPQSGPDVFGPTLAEQVVGPDAAALRDTVARDYDTLRGRAQVPYGQPAGRLSARLRGYLVEAADPDNVVLRVLTASATTDGGTVLTATRLQLTWTGMDWALVAPAGGTWNQSVEVVEAADGYLLLGEGR